MGRTSHPPRHPNLTSHLHQLSHPSSSFQIGYYFSPLSGGSFWGLATAPPNPPTCRDLSIPGSIRLGPVTYLSSDKGSRREELSRICPGTRTSGSQIFPRAEVSDWEFDLQRTALAEKNSCGPTCRNPTGMPDRARGTASFQTPAATSRPFDLLSRRYSKWQNIQMWSAPSSQQRTRWTLALTGGALLAWGPSPPAWTTAGTGLTLLFPTRSFHKA